MREITPLTIYTFDGEARTVEATWAGIIPLEPTPLIGTIISTIQEKLTRDRKLVLVDGDYGDHEVFTPNVVNIWRSDSLELTHLIQNPVYHFHNNQPAYSWTFVVTCRDGGQTAVVSQTEYRAPSLNARGYIYRRDIGMHPPTRPVYAPSWEFYSRDEHGSRELRRQANVSR